MEEANLETKIFVSITQPNPKPAKRKRIPASFSQRLKRRELKAKEEEEELFRRLMENDHQLKKNRNENDDAAANLIKQSILGAGKAVAYYNRKNKGVKLELVEPKAVTSLMCDGSLWSHSNFLAKPKKSRNSDSAAADSSPAKLFFVEISHLGLNKDRVLVCGTVDPGDSRTDGCGFCDPDHESPIYHPTDGYKAGRFPYHPNNIFCADFNSPHPDPGTGGWRIIA